MQTYTVLLASENSYQFDSRDCKGWREQPHLESPGSFSCLANSHMCQTSPPTQHISHIPKECLLFYQVNRINPALHCVSSTLSSFPWSFYEACFILCNSFFAQSSVFLQSHWNTCFSQWVFMSSWADHKDSFPVLSFPQWRWESWRRAWALAVAPTITYASVLPVISDYIKVGNKDILHC